MEVNIMYIIFLSIYNINVIFYVNNCYVSVMNWGLCTHTYFSLFISEKKKVEEKVRVNLFVQ